MVMKVNVPCPKWHWHLDVWKSSGRRNYPWTLALLTAILTIYVNTMVPFITWNLCLNQLIMMVNVMLRGTRTVYFTYNNLLQVLKSLPVDNRFLSFMFFEHFLHIILHTIHIPMAQIFKPLIYCFFPISVKFHWSQIQRYSLVRTSKYICNRLFIYNIPKYQPKETIYSTSFIMYTYNKKQKNYKDITIKIRKPGKSSKQKKFKKILQLK